MTQRLGYVGYIDPDSGADAGAVEFETIDTTNPASPVLMQPVALDLTPNGVIGSRSTTGPGGTINLVRLNGCTSTCNVELVPILLPNSGASFTGTVTAVGTAPRGSFPSYASTSSHLKAQKTVDCTSVWGATSGAPSLLLVPAAPAPGLNAS